MRRATAARRRHRQRRLRDHQEHAVRRGQNLQIRVEMFNATNTRNFGIPDGRVNSANFLNQWATDGGNRRIWAALRYTF